MKRFIHAPATIAHPTTPRPCSRHPAAVHDCETRGAQSGVGAAGCALQAERPFPGVQWHRLKGAGARLRRPRAGDCSRAGTGLGDVVGALCSLKGPRGLGPRTQMAVRAPLAVLRCTTDCAQRGAERSAGAMRASLTPKNCVRCRARAGLGDSAGAAVYCLWAVEACVRCAVEV